MRTWRIIMDLQYRIIIFQYDGQLLNVRIMKTPKYYKHVGFHIMLRRLICKSSYISFCLRGVRRQITPKFPFKILVHLANHEIICIWNEHFVVIWLRTILNIKIRLVLGWNFMFINHSQATNLWTRIYNKSLLLSFPVF